MCSTRVSIALLPTTLLKKSLIALCVFASVYIGVCVSSCFFVHSCSIPCDWEPGGRVPTQIKKHALWFLLSKTVRFINVLLVQKCSQNHSLSTEALRHSHLWRSGQHFVSAAATPPLGPQMSRMRPSGEPKRRCCLWGPRQQPSPIVTLQHLADQSVPPLARV